MATKSETAEIAVLQTQMKTVIEQLKTINNKLENKFVTQREFSVAKWLFGIVIVVGLGILSFIRG